MTVTQEKTIWESVVYKLRIVEVRMFTTLDLLAHRIERFQDGMWRRIDSRTTLTEAQMYVEYHFGINIQEQNE